MSTLYNRVYTITLISFAWNFQAQWKPKKNSKWKREWWVYRLEYFALLLFPSILQLRRWIDQLWWPSSQFIQNADIQRSSMYQKLHTNEILNTTFTMIRLPIETIDESFNREVLKAELIKIGWLISREWDLIDTYTF